MIWYLGCPRSSWRAGLEAPVQLSTPAPCSADLRGSECLLSWLGPCHPPQRPVLTAMGPGGSQRVEGPGFVGPYHPQQRPALTAMGPGGAVEGPIFVLRSFCLSPSTPQISVVVFVSKDSFSL